MRTIIAIIAVAALSACSAAQVQQTQTTVKTACDIVPLLDAAASASVQQAVTQGCAAEQALAPAVAAAIPAPAK